VRLLIDLQPVRVGGAFSLVVMAAIRRIPTSTKIHLLKLVSGVVKIVKLDFGVSVALVAYGKN